MVSNIIRSLTLVLFLLFLSISVAQKAMALPDAPANNTYHQPEKLSVLASSFSPESRRNYPTWIKKMESAGYGNAIWQELEDILYDSGRFDLLMEPPLASEQFRQILSTRGQGGLGGNNLHIEMPDRILMINVNFFVKETQTLQGMTLSTNQEFHATVHLRYYNLDGGRAINRPVPATGDAMSGDLLEATRIATRNASQKLLHRLGKI